MADSDSAHDDIASPPLDFAAWRGVLRGLQLVRVGLGLGLVSAVASCVCCVPLALVFAFSASWWRQSLGVLVVGINLGSPILINIGMAFCCQAPADSVAKRYARMALTLTLIFAGMLFLLLGAVAVVNDHIDMRSFRIVVHSPKFSLIVLTMLLLDLTFAVHCWQLFLKTAAAQFDLPQLTVDHLDVFRWWFSGWTICAFVCCLYATTLHDSETMAVLAVLTGLPALFGLPALWGLQMIMLQQLEDNVRPIIAPPPRPEPRADALDQSRDR